MMPTHLAEPCHIVVMGKSGVGKSAFSNFLAKVLGSAEGPFAEGYGANARTQRADSHSALNVTIIDTSCQEDVHALMAFLRYHGSVNAFLLVVNERDPRVDKETIAAVKRFSDFFGASMWENSGILFTQAFVKSSEDSRDYVRGQLVPVLRREAQCPLDDLPSWQMDCHPEELSKLGVPDSKVADLQTRAREGVAQMILWARSLPRVQVPRAQTDQDRQAFLRHFLDRAAIPGEV